MRKITLEDGKEIQISEESYKELAKAVRKKDYKTLEEMYKDNLLDSYYSDTCFGIESYSKENTIPIEFLEEGHVYEEKVLKQEKARRHLANIAFILNKGWEADWEDAEQIKWVVYYNTRFDEYRIDDTYTFNYLAPVFKSEELARKALELIGKNLLNDDRGE